MKLLEEKGCDRLFFDSLIRRDDLEIVRDRLDEYLQRSLESPNIREDLKAFVEALGDESEPIEEVIRCIEKSEHAGFIYDICKHLIMNPTSKTNAVYIYGQKTG